MEWQRRQHEECLEKKIVTEEDKVRLSLARTYRLEAQATLSIPSFKKAHTLMDLPIKESSKYKTPSFKPTELFHIPNKYPRIEIPSFKSFHPKEEIAHVCPMNLLLLTNSL